MKEELLVIEEGELIVNENIIFNDLYLQIYKSETLGIIFDNVKERRYLLELFRGERALSGGKVLIGNKKHGYDNTVTFFKKNVTVIDKNSKLIDNFTIEENIFLFAEENHIVSNKKLKYKLRALFNKFDLDLNLDRPIKSLQTKERIIIELLKAYYEDKRLVVFDHVSSILLNNDFNEVYLLLQKLKKYGMSFVIIEYFNNIIFEWVNSFILIQRGKTTGIFESNSYDIRKLFSILAEGARPFNTASMNYGLEANVNSDVHVMTFKNIFTDHIRDLNIEISSGEILKIIYMDDTSCEHIVNLLKGDLKPVLGEITLQGKKLEIDNIGQAIRKGICFVEEAPYENTHSYDMTVMDNLGLPLSYKVPFFWLRKRYRKSINHFLRFFQLEDFADVKLKHMDPRALQVISYLKWYLYAPHVVVCIKPFVELDINLKEITKEMILLLKSRGISVIILTSVLSETHMVEGKNVYIKDGRVIRENEVYHLLYKQK